MNDLIKQVAERVTAHCTLVPDSGKEKILFNKKGYANVDVSPDHYMKIAPVSEGRVAFIDGGNAEILKSSSMSIHFVQIAVAIYDEKKRECSKIHKVFTITTPSIKDGKTYYITECLGDDLAIASEDLVYESTDATLKNGVHEAPLSKMGEVVRRFAELSLATRVEADVVVLDGALLPSYAHEGKYLEALRDAHQHVVGVSKSTSTLTSKNRSVSAALMSVPGKWQHQGAQPNTPGLPSVCFAKLHDDAQHAFRIDYWGTAIDVLAAYATDPVFIGYPYGLIEADQLARVSHHEAQMIKTTFLALMSKNLNELRLQDIQFNAHAVLDKIRF